MTVEEQLAAYLAARWGRVVRVANLRRFHGGAARETCRFDAITDEGTRALVLRRDPPSSLIETDRRVEFQALAAFYGTDVPVPEPLFVETDPASFGAPGFIMAEVPDVRAAGLFEADPYGEARAEVGIEMFSILGRIHARDPFGVADVLDAPAPEDCWRVRLDHWRRSVDADALGPEPIFRAGVRWLERNPPPPPERVAIVHGDYRSGNFLVGPDNRIRAIVDWELVHLGDPIEDLAWAMDPLWSHGTPERPGGTIPEADAIAAWERASGLVVDSERLRWWRVFAQVMGLAIWISSGREVADGRSVDPVMAFSAFFPYRFHNRALAATLRALAA
jgi:aminoglycoside phosphotransferase (APT) family kinase protein